MKNVQASRIGIGCFFLLLVIIGGCWQFSDVLRSNCQAEPINTNYTIQTNSTFKEYWSLPDVFILDSETAINLVASRDNLIFYGSLDACHSPRMIVINPINGEVINTSPRLPANRGIYNIAYDDESVYLGFNGPGKAVDDSTVDAGGVVAYQFDSESIAWTRHIPGTRGMRSLAAGGEVIVVDGGSFSRRYYLLDSANGEILETLEKDTTLGYVPYAFWLAYIHNIENMDNGEGIEYWKEKLMDVEQPPILLETTLIIRTNSGSATGKIKALDRASGNILWETSNDIASNVATNDMAAFFLTNSAELFAVDITTGQTIDSIKLSSQVNKEEDRGFFVAANNQAVFVYLGDARRLIAFQFSQNNIVDQ